MNFIEAYQNEVLQQEKEISKALNIVTTYLENYLMKYGTTNVYDFQKVIEAFNHSILHLTSYHSMLNCKLNFLKEMKKAN